MKVIFAVFSVLLLIAASLTIQPEQENFGWFLFAVFLVLFAIKKHHNPFLRVLCITLGAFISLRYLLFRIFFTLNLESNISLVLALLLFLAEFYAIVTHFMGLFVNIKPTNRAPAPLPQKLPSIDVFIPTYDEEEEVALATAIACKNFDYPPELVNIYILNDGSRLPRLNNPQLRDGLAKRHAKLKKLAQEAGVHYLTREGGEQAKAGMVKAAFSGKGCSDVELDADGVFRGSGFVKTNGDLILMLDCDHVPTRDMPKTVVGHFSDPKVFLVQTPHFMLNADPLRKNLQGENRIPCESWLFYMGIQKGLDGWGASFFCGSAAFLRRKALEEVGGLCGDTITEDAETALALHSRGYSSVYVEKPMVAGLAPESVPDMLNQRARWCQGMIQILLLKNPLFQKGLKFAQRICYLNSCLFWIFPVFRLIFILAPLMFLLFNINIYNASVEQVIAFSIPHFLASIMLSAYIFQKLRPYPQSDILEVFQMFFLLPAILAVFLSPRKPIFKTTRKGVTMDKDMPSPCALPILFFLGLISSGFIFGLISWLNNPFLHNALIITLVWNAFNGLFLLFALGVMFERKQRRSSYRFAVSEAASLEGQPVMLTDLSGQGFALNMDGKKLHEGQTYTLESGNFKGQVKITRVHEDQVNGVFVKPLSREVIDFVYGDSSRWSRAINDVFQAGGSNLSQLVFIFRSSLGSACMFLRAFARRIMPLFLLAATGLLLVAEPCFANSSSMYVSSLLGQNKYEVAENAGMLRIPVHISERTMVQNVFLDLIYSTPSGPNSTAPQITLTVDEEDIQGRTSRLSESESIIHFSVPKNKLIPGERVLSVNVEQTPPQDGSSMLTSFDLSKSKIYMEYSLTSLKDNAKNIELMFDPDVPEPLAVHVVFGKLDEAHLLRAIHGVQKIGIFLKNRPMQITASFQPVNDRDNIIISDNPAAYAALTPNQQFALLNENDLEKINLPAPQNVLRRGTKRTFKDFGLETILFRPGYSMRNTFFIIPSETRLTPNRKLTLSLDLAYSAGLNPDSRIEAYMNGELLTWVHLRNANGAYHDNYTVEVPTSLLRKGVNTIGLLPRLIPASASESETANSSLAKSVNSSSSGAPGNSNNSEPQLYATVFSSSTLSLPDTGTYVMLPELATFLTDGYPFSGNALLYVENPTTTKAAAVLNISALVAQRRGTIGKNLTVHFTPWAKEDRYAYIFSTDPSLAQHIFQMKEIFVPNSDYKIALFFSAPNEDDLLNGTYRLWQPSIQASTKGESMQLNVQTGKLSYQEGESVIISDALPFPHLAFYANNYPTLMRIAVGAVLLMFSFLAYTMLKKRRN